MLVNPEQHSPIIKSTIQDIARELKITASTVSRALNGHPGISITTKAEVERIAKDRNYQKHHIASSLRLGKSRIIGLIIPSAEISFFGSVIHGIEKVCREQNYNVLIFQSNEEPDFEKKAVQTFLGSRVDGILGSISKETIDPEHYREIRKRGIPLVLFDRVSDNLEMPSVLVDDYRGAFKATQHLIDQGCRRIAHIGGQQHVLIFNQRLRGYVDALKNNNLPVDEEIAIIGFANETFGKYLKNKRLQFFTHNNLQI